MIYLPLCFYNSEFLKKDTPSYYMLMLHVLFTSVLYNNMTRMDLLAQGLWCPVCRTDIEHWLAVFGFIMNLHRQKHHSYVWQIHRPNLHPIILLPMGDGNAAFRLFYNESVVKPYFAWTIREVAETLNICQDHFRCAEWGYEGQRTGGYTGVWRRLR